MTKRELILEHIKIASYNGDNKKCMELFCNNRISRAAYDKAFNLGQRMRNTKDGFVVRHNDSNHFHFDND